jgi:hypothetical protein
VGVEKQKGFRIEYCHVNDEYVAMLKDTPYMGVAATIDEAIAQLEADVGRGEGDGGDSSESAGEPSATETEAPADETPTPAEDFSAVDHVSFGGSDDDEEH